MYRQNNGCCNKNGAFLFFTYLFNFNVISLSFFVYKFYTLPRIKKDFVKSKSRKLDSTKQTLNKN